jgi:hypothetical protein
MPRISTDCLISVSLIFTWTIGVESFALATDKFYLLKYSRSIQSGQLCRCCEQNNFKERRIIQSPFLGLAQMDSSRRRFLTINLSAVVQFSMINWLFLLTVLLIMILNSTDDSFGSKLPWPDFISSWIASEPSRPLFNSSRFDPVLSRWRMEEVHRGWRL